MQDFTPLQSQAYNTLKKRILSNQLEYGVTYSLTKTAKELGISRTPAKDAITRLSNEKYIDLFPSKGFRLHELSKSDIANTYQIRSALECYAAFDLSSSKSARAKGYIKKLKNYVESMEEAIVQSKPLKDLLEYDSLFHFALVQYLDNPEILALYDSYVYNLRAIATKTFRQDGRTADATAEHRRIIDAIESCNAQEAYEAVRFHLEITKNIANKYYR